MPPAHAPQVDPLGNRPMTFDCDESGWMLTRQTVVTHGISEVQEECGRKDADLPLPTRFVTIE